MSDEQKEEIELYKLEYKTAYERYENIYQAIWRIFNVLAVTSGGIIAFIHSGKPGTSSSFAAFVAFPALLFWFFSTYLPMDRYGRDTLQRLTEIERKLNSLGELLSRVVEI